MMYLVYGAEGVLTVDEAILKDGVPSRDLPEEPRYPRIGVWPDILAGSSKTGFWKTTRISCSLIGSFTVWSGEAL